MPEISRRDFVALAAVGAVATPFAATDAVARPAGALTAQDIVDRVKKSVGVEWRADDVDTFKAGDPSTVVTGVVTTSMATLDVLQKAVQSGANLVITAAPTFYTKADLSTPGGAGARRRPGPVPGPRGRAGRSGGPRTSERQRSGHRRVGADATGTPDAAVRRAAAPAGAVQRSRHPPAPDPVYAGEERFHRQAQTGGVPADAALEPAHARSARPGPGAPRWAGRSTRQARMGCTTRCRRSRSRRSPAS